MRATTLSSLVFNNRDSAKKHLQLRCAFRPQLKSMLVKARARKGSGCRIKHSQFFGPGISYPDGSLWLLVGVNEHTHAILSPHRVRNTKARKPIYPQLVMWQEKRLCLLGKRNGPKKLKLFRKYGPAA